MNQPSRISKRERRGHVATTTNGTSRLFYYTFSWLTRRKPTVYARRAAVRAPGVAAASLWRREEWRRIMVGFKVRQVNNALLGKLGFEKTETHHRIYQLWLDGRVAARTYISHGEQASD
jgi:hypothetical protein